MTKTELVQELARELEISRDSAIQVVDTMVGCIISALEKGEAVKLSPLGVFTPIIRKASHRKTPQGAHIQVPPRRAIRYRPGISLRTILHST